MIEIELYNFSPGYHLLEAAKKGETILLIEWGKPVAEVKPLPGILEPPSLPPCSPPEHGESGNGVWIHPDAFRAGAYLQEDELAAMLERAREEGKRQ